VTALQNTGADSYAARAGLPWPASASRSGPAPGVRRPIGSCA